MRHQIVHIYTESGEYLGTGYLEAERNKYWYFGVSLGMVETVEVRDIKSQNIDLSTRIDREKQRKELWDDIINNRKPYMMYGRKVTPKGQVLVEVQIPVPKNMFGVDG